MGRAIAFTAPGQAEIVEVDDGPVGPGQVAGRTLLSLVSPGTELAVYAGEASGYPDPPFFPGYAAVFRIDELGSEVQGFAVGQVVYCMGGHRSWQCQPSETVLLLPPGLDPAAAVYARLAGVSMTTLVTTAARPPGPVLVLGLGLVGNLAAQVFQAAGYDVVARDPVESRVVLGRQAGIADARTELEASDLLPAFSLVVECSGHEDALLEGCRLVRQGGEVVLVGVPWHQRSSTTAHQLAHELFHRFVHLRGGWEWELPMNEEPWRTGSILGNHAHSLRWLAEGSLKVGGLATEVDPEHAQEAYQALLRQKGPLTRIFNWEASQKADRAHRDR